MKALAASLALLLFAGCSPSRNTLLPGGDGGFRPSGISAYSGLRGHIDALLPDSLFPPSNASIVVVSLTTGEVLYALNPGLAFTPASNQKLFTSAAALNELGPDYRFVTRAYFDTGATARIYVAASGDPLLTTGDIDSLARRITSALPPGRTWAVAGDVSFFDDLPRGRGWNWDDEPDPTGMFITPLSVNGNAIRVRVSAGPLPGDSAWVTTNPATRYVQVENSAVTSVDSPKTSIEISRRWREHSNVITVSGVIRPADSAVTALLSVAGPEWYALTLLREALEAHGVPCSGVLLDSVPRGLTEIASCAHNLDSVLTYMNLVSDNLSAENLLKTMGAERWGRPGSADGGARAMRQVLTLYGVDSSAMVIADGSGLSRYNLTSAWAIATLLSRMAQRDDLFPLWYSTLPVAGKSGTLSGRMKNTPAEGNLHAKTGTLAGVSSLSGFVTTTDGEKLAFSMLMQHFPSAARGYRQVQDRIGAFLAGLKRRDF
jgi:serine-type D-Ala-D-Ala carboxypeptidase/endopeptidase (penicillin-binding protein 4)